MLWSILRLFFIFLSSTSVFGLSEPKEPAVPTVKRFEVKKSRTTKPNKKKIEPGVSRLVHVTLGSDDTLKGHIAVPLRLQFKHYKNGFIYTKKVNADEIKSIVISSYHYQLSSRKQGVKYYHFEPGKIRLSLHNGRTYEVGRLFKFLRQFKIETIDGTTTLYSFFADSYHPKKGWSEVVSKNLSYHKSIPHPQSVKKVQFIPEGSTTAAGD